MPTPYSALTTFLAGRRRAMTPPDAMSPELEPMVQERLRLRELEQQEANEPENPRYPAMRALLQRDIAAERPEGPAVDAALTEANVYNQPDVTRMRQEEQGSALTRLLLPAQAKAEGDIRSAQIAAQGRVDAARESANRSGGLTPSMKAGIQRLGTSLKMLQELDPSLTQQSGLAGRLSGMAQQGYSRFTGENEQVNTYDAVSSALLPALARSSGEVGNLAEKEQVRYERLAPKASDPINIRQAKYAAIQYIVDAAQRGATSDDMVPFLDYMRFAQGEASAPRATVHMRAPNGQVKAVPADQVDHYRSLGAEVVR